MSEIITTKHFRGKTVRAIWDVGERGAELAIFGKEVGPVPFETIVQLHKDLGEIIAAVGGEEG